MGNISIKSNEDMAHVGSDIYAPTRIELTAVGMDDLAADVTAVLVLDGRRYSVQELRITRREDGPPITGELIRRIPVKAIIRGSVSDSAELREPGREVTFAEFTRILEVDDPDAARRMVTGGPTDEMLLWVARIYVMAELAGDPPAKAVKENLDIPMPTANNWIRRAKDRGILDG